MANHIFFHDLDGAYNRSAFLRTRYARGDVPGLQHRAFAAAWQRTPRPLFGLLEQAGSDVVRSFAAEALKSDFRTQLREVEPAWVVRLIGVRSAAVDTFVVWLLQNVPRFEPGAFRTLGLHDAVMTLLDSSAEPAASWAAEYARTHGRDLPLRWLIRLANSDHAAVRELARALLQDRDPRDEVGLEAWGELLGTSHGHELAVQALQEHFGARELTLPWFMERLLSGNRQVIDFASNQLPKVHPDAQVPTSFYAELLDHPRVDNAASKVAVRALTQRDLGDVSVDVLRRALLNSMSRSAVQRWVRDGRLEARQLEVPFLKALAFHVAWESDAWLTTLRGSERKWAQRLEFDESLSQWVLNQLADARRSVPMSLASTGCSTW